MGLSRSIQYWARPRHSRAGIIASLMLSVLAYPLLGSGANTPDTGLARLSAAAAPSAHIERSGDDIIIVGSVATLFNTGFFAGPNRAQKVNRSRLTPDGVTVSGGFEAIRMQIAEARASIDPATTGSIGDASAALSAIDQVVPMPLMPASVPVSLAYARETTPPTAFDKLVDKSGKAVSEKELWCMATAIYFEARGEAYRGQVAVAQVVMNRVAHRLYPDTICNVVFQNEHMRNACQFSFACDGIPERITDKKSWAQAEEIATGVINGSLYITEVGKSTHYHATYVYPHWAPRLKRNTKIGHHIFYQFKRA
jgi:hypothetical protein